MARNREMQLLRPWCALCLCVVTIFVQNQISSGNDDVQPPWRVKRNSVSDPGIDFLQALKNRPVDLIILMERSRTVTRWWFYNRIRKLVSYVLRYYAKMGPSNVKLVVVTFATDFTVHIHGMRDTILKCQIWDKYWDNVVLDDAPYVWNMAHVKRVYEKARDIFDTHGSESREKYIWLLTSGNYDMDSSIYNPLPIAAELRNMGVQIVATKVGGNEGHNENIRQIITSDQHHVGEVQDWIAALNNVVEIKDAPNLRPFNATCSCEQSFGFTICGRCLSEPCDTTCSQDCICDSALSMLCPKLDARIVCRIYSGDTGRYCERKVIECVHGTCGNNGVCHEGQGTFSCTCPGTYSPDHLCDQNKTGPSIAVPSTTQHPSINSSGAKQSDPTSVGPAVGGAVGGLTLIIILVAGFCIWKKRGRPETQNVGTSTVQNRPSTISTIRSLFRRDRETRPPSPSSTGTYLDFERLPPTLPTSLPPPTVRVLKSKPRKLLPKLEYVPEHMPPSMQQLEIEKAVSNFYMGQEGDHEGAAVEDDVEESGDYENVGSKNMPGWENYVMKLATVGGLRNFAIVKYDRKAYVTTCEIWLLPSKEELSNIYNVLLSCQTGGYIKLKSARYKVTKNNGKMLESWLEGRTPDVLCVGRSKQYLVLGVETDRNNTGNCYQEVSWVRENLSEQHK